MTITRTVLQPSISVAVVSALAFAPLLAAPLTTAPPAPAIAQLRMPDIALSAAVKPADIDKLIANLNRELENASATVTGLVGAPGGTLIGALDSAVDLNNSLWKQLSAATDNTFLRQVLAALKASSNSGLKGLADTVKSANSTVTLTTGQLADLLSSVLTGSLSTALHAVANLLNDPLSLSSYIGLVGVPLRVAGLAATEVLAGAGDLGVNALSLTSTLVTGVTAQIDNALSAFNGVVNATKKAVGEDLISGALTAVQGIVAAPVTAILAAVDGGVPALTGALGSAVSRLADGASGVVGTWLGDGTEAGAVERVLNVVGAAPLSPSSYTSALGILVGAGVATGASVAHTVSSLASIPFTAAAKLTITGGNVIAALASATAKVASGLLQMAGLPSAVHNLPYTVAKVINAAVKTAAAVTAAALNTIGTGLNAATSVTGVLTHTNTRVVALSATAATRSVSDGAAVAVGKSDAATGSATPATKTQAKGVERGDEDGTEQDASEVAVTARTEANTPVKATGAASENSATDKESSVSSPSHESATPTKDAETPKAGAQAQGESTPSPKSGSESSTTSPNRGATDAPSKRGAEGKTPSDVGGEIGSSRHGKATPGAAADETRDASHGQQGGKGAATSPKHAAGSSKTGESVRSIKARVAAGSASGGRS